MSAIEVNVTRWYSAYPAPGPLVCASVSFPLTDLDRTRSTPARRPGGTRQLWSTDGKAITLFPPGYPPDELSAFLHALGLS